MGTWINKKSILTVSIILIIIFIVGFLIFKFVYGGKTVYQQEAEREMRLCKEALKDRCDAIVNKDASFCDKIINPKRILNDTKEDCKEVVPLVIYYAEKINSDKCNSIATTYYSLSQEEVKNDCTTVLKMLESKDESACDNFRCKYAYYIARAASENNPALCDNIGDDKVAIADCKMISSSKASYCEYSPCEEGAQRIVDDAVNQLKNK